MKEQTSYVAIDADNVGDSVGGAILNDDTDSLSSISQNITAGTQIFTQWAEFNGGTVISNGSDEAILQIPVTSIGELEQLKDKYEQQTGFTISIGIGDTVSNAAKALIYGKMNGKDQITDYSPEMEEAMKQSISGVDEGGSQQDTLPHQESAAEEVSEESEKPLEPTEEDLTPEHEKELSPEDKALHDSTESMSDEEEMAQEDLAAQAEGELLPEEEGEAPIEEEGLEEMAISDNPQDEDIDLDGQPDADEEHGEINPEIDDLDEDGDVEHEEAMASQSAEEESYDDSGDFADDEGEYVEEEGDELSDSIADEMGEEEMPIDEEMPMEEEMGEEMPMEEEGAVDEEGMPIDEEMGEEMPMEEGMEEEIPMEEGMEEESVDPDALKNIIFESLQNFKAHREYLEGVSQENPELYQSLIFVLQAMIEMARELGYGNMDEELPMDEEGTVDEAMAVEEEMEEDEDLNPEDFAVGEDEEMGEEIPMEEEELEEEEPEEEFVKNERLVGLLKKMSTAFSEMSLGKKEEAASIQELKEKIQEKISQKGKTGKKTAKSKKSAKKPSGNDKKKKSAGSKKSGGNEGSFCAKSHKKMRAAGKDCRASEDADSPLCTARKKYSCRGKNEEKKKSPMGKSEEECDGDFKDSEKLSKFLKKKGKK